ncbi:MAG: FAD-binding protein [Candidatus Ornithospirochaeta sp.]
MKEYTKISNTEAYCVETLIVGTGAAGFNAADLLYKGGARNIAIVTEGIKAGTSRNTGSDKQTYYKLSLSGDDKDSVRDLAQDLFNGGCVDGDVALVEASLSTPSFLRLVELGVPFPTNRYGEYVGYKTDHDPHRRATSAGPYTSRFMTEKLEAEVMKDGIEILDGYQLVRILTENEEVKGAVFIERKSGKPLVILCRNLILATGGPAGIYSLSVYPISQYGATGIALECGAMGRNLTEWQYGLASLKPRWNVSGSYMQVLPRFVSVDEEGNEYDFLSDYVYSRPEMLSRVFLKGYQWPFDVRKLESGSSIVDILCLLEAEKGRRVYLDFMHNPDFAPIPWSELSEESMTYLEVSGATDDTPIERLKKLNLPAYDFYLDKGVDLEKEYLEIGLCAQHNNGGLSINTWWESNIKGLFPVGECAASHGVYRPGGSALNAGQCGSKRAVTWILSKCTGDWSPGFEEIDKVKEVEDMISSSISGELDADSVYDEVRRIMSISGSALRNSDDMKKSLSVVDGYLSSFSNIKVKNEGRIWNLFQLRNALITQKVYLSAMIEASLSGNGSRGSSLYSDKDGKIHPRNLDDRFTYSLEGEGERLIQEVKYEKGEVNFSYRKPRPIPLDDDFFENVWREYRKNKNIF